MTSATSTTSAAATVDIVARVRAIADKCGTGMIAAMGIRL